jgi:hypothetical protein
MKLAYWLPVLILLASGAAFAVDKSAIPPSNDVSPLEQHPECMDRTAAANNSNCIVQDGGAPRHRYPPKALPRPRPAPVPKPAVKPAAQAARLPGDGAK